MGVGGGRGEGHLRRGTSRRGAERQRAQRGKLRRRWGTREPATFQDVSCRHESPAWIACQPHAPLNPMNLCTLCLSAPLRESKTTTTRDSTNPLPSQPPCPLSTSRPLSTQSISALSASPHLCVSQKRRRRAKRRILCPLNPMTPLNLTTPLNPMNLCALCLSAPLREAKTTTRETPGSGAAADASSIWYNVDGSSEQPSTAEQSGWRP